MFTESRGQEYVHISSFHSDAPYLGGGHRTDVWERQLTQLTNRQLQSCSPRSTPILLTSPQVLSRKRLQILGTSQHLAVRPIGVHGPASKPNHGRALRDREAPH